MIYEISGLGFAYPSSGRPVLSNVSFTLAEGEILTILGPNGAGKSTLLKCMLNLLRPDEGQILLSGKSIASLSERETAALVSYVQQTQEATFAYSVFDFVLMGRAPGLGLFERPGKADRDAAARAIEAMGIAPLAQKPLTELSGGERQQAMIARAIAREPSAILFDEPTAHLDSGNQLRALRMIKRLADSGYALVVTTHNPDHALLLGGSAALLDNEGRLRKGGAEEMITEENLNDVYGADLKLVYLEEAGRTVCIYPKL